MKGLFSSADSERVLEKSAHYWYNLDKLPKGNFYYAVQSITGHILGYTSDPQAYVNACADEDSWTEKELFFSPGRKGR